MKATFQVGDTVTWTSQAGGNVRTKTGKVEEVVPAGALPNRARFEQLFRSSGVGAARAHMSYVVRVPGKTTKAAGTVYWPRAASLQLLNEKEPQDHSEVGRGTQAFTFLPKAISLPSGVVAKIELIPMPKPDAAGQYLLNPPNTEIQVSLFRNDKLIERRRWDTLISGSDVATLADGSVLDADDLYELDSAGWEVMGDFGMIPTVFAG